MPDRIFRESEFVTAWQQNAALGLGLPVAPDAYKRIAYRYDGKDPTLMAGLRKKSVYAMVSTSGAASALHVVDHLADLKYASIFNEFGLSNYTVMGVIEDRRTDILGLSDPINAKRKDYLTRAQAEEKAQTWQAARRQLQEPAAPSPRRRSAPPPP